MRDEVVEFVYEAEEGVWQWRWGRWEWRYWRGEVGEVVAVWEGAGVLFVGCCKGWRGQGWREDEGGGGAFG